MVERAKVDTPERRRALYQTELRKKDVKVFEYGGFWGLGVVGERINTLQQLGLMSEILETPMGNSTIGGRNMARAVVNKDLFSNPSAELQQLAPNIEAAIPLSGIWEGYVQVIAGNNGGPRKLTAETLNNTRENARSIWEAAKSTSEVVAPILPEGISIIRIDANTPEAIREEFVKFVSPFSDTPEEVKEDINNRYCIDLAAIYTTPDGQVKVLGSLEAHPDSDVVKLPNGKFGKARVFEISEARVVQPEEYANEANFEKIVLERLNYELLKKLARRKVDAVVQYNRITETELTVAAKMKFSSALDFNNALLSEIKGIAEQQDQYTGEWESNLITFMSGETLRNTFAAPSRRGRGMAA